MNDHHPRKRARYDLPSDSLRMIPSLPCSRPIRRATGPAPACERGGQGWSERDLMQLNGWTSPQMLRRYDASARDRRTYGCIMGDSP